MGIFDTPKKRGYSKKQPPPLCNIKALELRAVVEKKYKMRVDWDIKTRSIWGYTIAKWLKTYNNDINRFDQLLSIISKDWVELPVVTNPVDLLKRTIWIEQVARTRKVKEQVIN